MGEQDVEREAEFFRRVESRLVAVEIRLHEVEERQRKYIPIVEKLRDANMLAEEIARRVTQQRRSLITKVSVAAAIFSVFVPPILTALLVKLLAG